MPSNKALNIKKGKVEITFDENINVLESLSENVIISPPQREMPDIKSYGKR